MNSYILAIVLFFTLTSCKEKQFVEEHSHEKTESFYTCSMHPKVKEKKPGKCPICHMNLTKVEMDKAEKSSFGDKSNEKLLWRCKDFPDVTSESNDVCPIDGSPMIKVSKAAEVVSKIRLRKSQLSHFKPDFFPATTMKMNKDIRLLGRVLQSEEKESNIPARVDGRVEKVYVKSTGSFIQKGDLVVKIYSPKLITAGEEYILAKQTFEKSPSKEFQEILAQSEERLKLWGVRKSQFEKWYKTKTVPQHIDIYSPATGIVQKKNATVGKYFKEGQNFFELSDLSDVWVEMDVYEQESALVKLGQKLSLEFTALPGQEFIGEIDFIAPVLEEKSRTLKVRATIENGSGKLKPGMIADATLNLEFEGMPIVVPRSAVIDTGKRKVVWMKTGSASYQAIQILTGNESQGYIEVVDGLKEGQEVVVEGNFLLDAQAQLFGGYESMGGHHK